MDGWMPLMPLIELGNDKNNMPWLEQIEVLINDLLRAKPAALLEGQISQQLQDPASRTQQLVSSSSSAQAQSRLV